MSGTKKRMNGGVDELDKIDIGYDQSGRWTHNPNRDGKLATRKCEADCSALCGTIVQLGGYPVDLSGLFYTGNFEERLVKAGFKSMKYTGLDQIKPGDFILTAGRHVEYAYSKDKWYSARIDENGKIVGGRPGDQTGREVGFTAPYEPSSYRWQTVLRPPVVKRFPDAPLGITGVRGYSTRRALKIAMSRLAPLPWRKKVWLKTAKLGAGYIKAKKRFLHAEGLFKTAAYPKGIWSGKTEGKPAIAAWQHFLIREGYFMGEPDGKDSKALVRAEQRWLNSVRDRL